MRIRYEAQNIEARREVGSILGAKACLTGALQQNAVTASQQEFSNRKQ